MDKRSVVSYIKHICNRQHVANTTLCLYMVGVSHSGQQRTMIQGKMFSLFCVGLSVPRKESSPDTAIFTSGEVGMCC